MFNCRFLDPPHAPKPIHVHDVPGYKVDAWRGVDNGYSVSLDFCQYPKIPFTLGDARVRVDHILDLVERREE